MKLKGWGNYPQLEAVVLSPDTQQDLKRLVQKGNLIARGNGRAYGDSAVNEHLTLDMTRFNHILEFNEDTGVVTAEAGVLLADIIDVFLPRGWFPPVTPGTKFVTIGGMTASDVHGKNHHLDGAFSSFIDWIELLDGDGNVKKCSRRQNKELFNWTIGGMGLTGIILRIAFRLKRVETGWIEQRIVRTQNLADTMQVFEDNDASPYSVAWIDCATRGPKSGRSLVMLGSHANQSDLSPEQRDDLFPKPRPRRLKVPFTFPGFVLNKYSVRIFNEAYYRWAGRSTQTQHVKWDGYFYPLDSIGDWNKIYGRKGFAQFQCAIPMSSAASALAEILDAVSRSSQGSFLSVLKRFGPQDNPFSFPLDGYTLTLDFPINKASLRLMEKLDEITLRHSGRFYLAKDSRMTADVFHASDPRIIKFVKARDKMEATSVFISAQSERLKF